MANILYISLTGALEPLGESQVIQYLLELAKEHAIHLLSFEKPAHKEKFERMQMKLQHANIQWKYIEYSNRYGIGSTLVQVASAFFILAKLIRKERIQIIHARTFIPAMIGLLLKKISNIKLLFDIRGFAMDEKIMEGRFKSDAFLTRLLKRLEAKVYKNADHIVTLTHASKPIIEELYAIEADKITVIPTCADTELFKPISVTEKAELKQAIGFSQNDFIILRNGSLNSSYDFEGELKLFEQLAIQNNKIKFLFLNQGQHAQIKSSLQKYNIDEERYKIQAVPFDQVPRYLNLSDMLIFLINPTFAKQASLPTKFAEVVACHLCSVTTKFADMEYYFNSHRIGILLNLAEVHHETKKSAGKILDFIEKNQNDSQGLAQEFQQLFSNHFAKEIAVARYDRIYASLI